MQRRRVWIVGLALTAAGGFVLTATPPVVAGPAHDHHDHYDQPGHRSSRWQHGEGIRRHHGHHGRHHVRHQYADDYGWDRGAFGDREVPSGSQARHSVFRYHGLGYSYDPYRYHDPYRSRLRSAPEPGAGDAARYGDRPAALPTARRGWSLLLVKGDANGAMGVFGALARAYPRDAISGAGYALAAALLGEDEAAVGAMRWAVEADPVSLGDLTGNERLEMIVRDLLAYFAAEAGRSGGDVDALFMTAAMHYLLHEDNAALSAIAEAIHRGDSDRSARALYGLLQGEAVGKQPPLEA